MSGFGHYLWWVFVLKNNLQIMKNKNNWRERFNKLFDSSLFKEQVYNDTYQSPAPENTKPLLPYLEQFIDTVYAEGYGDGYKDGVESIKTLPIVKG